ncbi:MAG: tetratricopeptide repeat protein [Acidobacteria bacterium]|nr:tetratricopeptide repeat protein [Acidobacteriota bacterium]
MFSLSHLYYPWGFILQILALVHLVRRRAAFYWFWIILAGGFVGALAYIVVEVLPDAYLLRNAFDGFARRARIRDVETAILDNPSAGNFEDLADLLREQKEYAKAREAYDRAISIRSDSVHAFYYRALCALAMNDFSGAIEDLEHVVRKDSKFDYHRAAALLAHAYAMTGQNENAASLFAEVTQYSTIPETFYNYACFLKSQDRLPEAREWAQKTINKKRTMPRYMQRRERPWFGKAKDLLKELPSA